MMAEYSFVTKSQSEIVSKTEIESDWYHLGKRILKSLKDDPDFVGQIDGGTGESETNSSMLRRSIQCANSLKNMGLKTGDVMVLMAPHHLDQAVSFYAALYLGVAVAAIDRTFLVYELRKTFNTIKPKVIFCQSERVQDVRKAVDLSGLDSKIISFDKSPDTTSFSEMMEKHGDQVDVDNFKPTDFDPEETIAFLMSTSGTTGLPKSAALSHKNVMTGTAMSGFTNRFPHIHSVLIVAPLLWLSAQLNYLMSPLNKLTRIQFSHTLTPEHILELIGKYKPSFMIVTPIMMTNILKAAQQINCDLSCFSLICLSGSAVPKSLLEEIKSLSPNTTVADIYGIGEVGFSVFRSLSSPIGSCGKPFEHLQYKLVNTETGEEITEPHKRGELWIKTPGSFKGYYNNSEATAAALSKDGWFMTGDMMYRDENWNFYFVERIKLLLKYNTYQIAPAELEEVIRQHPAVLDVAVTSRDDPECGDLPVACVIPVPGAKVTEEEIQNLVKENLADIKQLRGGVIFLNELPLTASSKIQRQKLKELVEARAKEQAGI